MAIAFIRVSIISRSKGHSSLAASAYRSGSCLFDSRTAIRHNYTKRTDVKYQAVLLPEGTDSSFTDPAFLWNTLERAEKRKDSQLCKEITVALPKELNTEQQIEITRKFALAHFVNDGLACDMSIHDKGLGNPHAHLLVPFRRVEGNSFSKYKARDLNPLIKNGYVFENDQWNELWRAFQQRYFYEKGLDINVDLNHLIPSRHYGKYKGATYLKEENRLLLKVSRKLARHDIKNFIKLLSMKKSVFTENDIRKLLSKIINLDSDAINQATSRILSHKKIVKLNNENNRLKYSTTYHLKKEKKLFKRASKLFKQKKHLATIGIKRIVKQYALSEEQAFAFRYLLESPDIAVLSGKPGTGKTYLLKALNQQYQKYGYKVLGAALASRAAKGLQAGSDIPSSTIASLNYRLNKGVFKLSSNHIIVIDEAGMLDFNSLHMLIKYITQAKAKLILVGDSQQLKPIGKGDIFRGISEQIGHFSMEDIKRQKDQLDREASLNLSKGDIQLALNHYDSVKGLNFETSNTQMLKKAVENWTSDIQSLEPQECILLSFTRKSVLKLNKSARVKLKELEKLGEDEYIYPVCRNNNNTFDKKELSITKKLNFESSIKALPDKIVLSKGERIIFKKKDNLLGVDNGEMGTITDINDKHINTRLDDGRTIQFSKKQYQHFDYAYALTVHKSQGMSVNNAHVVIDSPYWDRHLSYVAMTRHKEKLNIYASLETYQGKNDLAKSLSKGLKKLNCFEKARENKVTCLSRDDR